MAASILIERLRPIETELTADAVSFSSFAIEEKFAPLNASKYRILAWLPRSMRRSDEGNFLTPINNLKSELP